MKHPASLFIIYLSFRGDAYPAAMKILRNKRLDPGFTEPAYLAVATTIRHKIQPILDGVLGDQDKALACIEALGISEAWGYLSEGAADGPFATAWGVLHDVPTRTIVEHLALAGETHAQISDTLRSQYAL